MVAPSRESRWPSGSRGAVGDLRKKVALLQADVVFLLCQPHRSPLHSTRRSPQHVAIRMPRKTNHIEYE